MRPDPLRHCQRPVRCQQCRCNVVVESVRQHVLALKHTATSQHYTYTMVPVYVLQFSDLGLPLVEVHDSVLF